MSGVSGFVVLWFCGFVVLWFCGFVVLWFCGVVVLWCCGFVVLWFCGVVVLWFCGFVGFDPLLFRQDATSIVSTHQSLLSHKSYSTIKVRSISPDGFGTLIAFLV